MDGPKIIFPDIATTPRFALDNSGFYSSNTTYFIPMSELYLLGLLNSKIGSFYFTQTCAGLEGKKETYLRFFGQYLEGFPVRLIDFSNSFDKSHHYRIVELVGRMLDLHKQKSAAKVPAEREALERQIAATDQEIDKLVYELYNLTEEEIKMVEEKD